VQDAGRNEGFDPQRPIASCCRDPPPHPSDAGIFADGDMIPLPCNPASISIGYGVRDGEKVIPLTSLVRARRCCGIPNAISFENIRSCASAFVRSPVAVDAEPTRRSAWVAAVCLPDVPMPGGSGYDEKRLSRHDRGVFGPLSISAGHVKRSAFIS